MAAPGKGGPVGDNITNIAAFNASALDDDDDGEDVKTLQYKVILLGDGAVGKTSIAMRFSDDQFSQNYKQPVGVDFFIRRIKVPPNYEIALQIWDIGGQSIGSKMITNYIGGAHAVLLCYDITNYESFANLEVGTPSACVCVALPAHVRLTPRTRHAPFVVSRIGTGW